MTPQETLAELQRRGVLLEPDGEGLRYQAPRGALTPELRQAMLEGKTELLALVTETCVCTPSKVPWNGQMPHCLVCGITHRCSACGKYRKCRAKKAGG